MNLYSIIGIISATALFVPLFIILAFRLIRYKEFIILFIYCLLAFSYNLMTEDLIRVPRNFERAFGIINNLLDVPLVITFMMMLSVPYKKIKLMRWALGIYLIYEIIIVSLYGISVKTVTLVMGPGLLMVFGFALTYFVQTVKRSFMHDKFIGKAIISSAFTFAYGCYIFIYLIHYVAAIPDIPNIFMLYYVITTIFTSLLGWALVVESKRKRKLEEMLVTRNELLNFFADEKKTSTSQKISGQFNLN